MHSGQWSPDTAPNGQIYFDQMAPWVKSTYIQGPPRAIGPTLMHSHSLLFKWIYPNTRAFRVIIAVLTGNIQTAIGSMLFNVFECLMVQINTHI